MVRATCCGEASATIVLSLLNSASICRHIPHGGAGGSRSLIITISSMDNFPYMLISPASAARSAHIVAPKLAFSMLHPPIQASTPCALIAAPTRKLEYGAYALRYARSALACAIAIYRSMSIVNPQSSDIEESPYCVNYSIYSMRLASYAIIDLRSVYALSVPIAQQDRALDSGSKGRRFESSWAYILSALNIDDT